MNAPALTFVAACSAVVLALGAEARATEPEPRWVGEPPQVVLPEELRNAQAIPLPEGATASDDDLPGDRDIVAFDVATGAESPSPASTPPVDLPDDPAGPGEEIYGDPAGAGVKTLYPVGYPTAFPYRTFAKMYSRFGTNWYECSGYVAGPFHILTTGACAHNGTQWSNEMVAYPGQNGYNVSPGYNAVHPFGEARAVTYRSYSAWVNHQNLSHNWALITVDRRLGDRVGWLARSSNVGALDLISRNGYDQYPSLTQFEDYSSVSAVYTNRIEMFDSVPDGMNGGPAWETVWGGPGGSSVIDVAVGISSYFNGTWAYATRLTNGKRADIDSWISQDFTSNVPTDRPDLQAYNTQRFLTGLIAPGDPFDVEFSIINLGYAWSDFITVDFYLNESKIFDGTEIYVGSRPLYPLGPMNTYTVTQTLQSPATIPLGNYYLGWRIDGGAVQEYATWNNEGWNWSHGGYPITVASAGSCGTLVDGPQSDGLGALLAFVLLSAGPVAAARIARRRGVDAQA